MSAAQSTGSGMSSSANRKAAISPARMAAFKILHAVERGHGHSDDLLRTSAVDGLSSPDHNLATALVLGVLRWQIRLDHKLQALLMRPGGKLDTEILIALRLGAFQILHMDRIPARAAIDESVELAKQSGHRFASGMVNAVLRKLAATPREDFSHEADAQLAYAEAHPSWLVERWKRLYGEEAAQTICRHGQAQPALTLRLLPPDADLELTQAGIMLEPGRLLSAARTLISGDFSTASALGERRVRVQDEGSQLVAEIAAVNLNRDEGKILDACAAPGGKTLILSERNPDAKIVACEASASRFEQLRQRVSFRANHIECRLADAAALEDDGTFDLVLADVPCSGTGTLGRNPEIRHRLHVEDLSRQAERQSHLLKAALRAVRPGGRVVYSTCSLEPEENRQVITVALSDIPNIHTVSLEASLDSLDRRARLAPGATPALKSLLSSEGTLLLLPGKFGTDGFFIALLERRA